MTIREIESGHDIMEVNRLAGVVWHEAYKGILSREQIAYMVERFQSVRALTEQLALEGYRYFLLEDEGHNVGYCGVQRRGDELFLSKAYLLKEARGKGYFRALVEFLCNQFGDIQRIRLTVNRHNDHAQQVYSHLGFRRVAEQQTEIGGGYVMDDYVYERLCKEE
jgi:RimJ/RimL family protein N-acetyltransferase